MSAPLAQTAGTVAWPTVLLIGSVCLGAAWYVSNNSVAPGKLICVVEYLWIICVLGAMARWIGGSWPSGNVYPAVPLVLLALAAASACRGEGPAVGAGSVLFWLVALVFAAVFTAGIREVDVSMLVPAEGTVWGNLGLVFLLPAVSTFLPGMRKKLSPVWLVSTTVFGTALTAMIAGSLSPAVAQSAGAPFYQWVRGLGLLGTLERFEAIVAVALTMGWFSALSYVMCVAGSLAEQYKSNWYRSGVWISAMLTGLGMLSDWSISAPFLAIGSAIMWIGLPLGSSLRVKINFNKFKNST